MSLLHDYLKVVTRLPDRFSEEELRGICNQIQGEEQKRFKNGHLTPQGENILLSIEVETDDDSETVQYLTIEKDSRGYFCGYWFGKRSSGEQLVRLKTWPLLENSAHKTVLEFVKIYRYLPEYIRDENTIF